MQATLPLFSEITDDHALEAAVEELHAATALYTAAPIVDGLLQRIDWPRGRRRLVDSSAGDGQFLVSALSMALSKRRIEDDQLVTILEGWEVHPFACSQARARVAATLISFGRSAHQAVKLAEQIVRNEDFLIQGPTAPYAHVIVGNPPYLRWTNVPGLLQEKYAGVVPKFAAKDLLHSFMERCGRVLHPDGEMLMVCSDRILTNLGAAKLREELGRSFGIEHVARLSSASTFYRPKSRRAGSPPRVHPIEIHLRRGAGQPLTAAPIHPGVDSAEYCGYPTLGELATVRLGPFLGNPGVFLLKTEDVRASGISLEHFVPAFDTDDFQGEELGTVTRYAIRTRPDEAPSDEILRHLERTMHLMTDRGRRGKFWMPPEGFHGLDLSRRTLIIPRVAKTPKARLAPSGHLPINHCLSIVCEDDQTLSRIHQALGGELAAKWVREHAARLEGGYHALTATLLRKLPIHM